MGTSTFGPAGFSGSGLGSGLGSGSTLFSATSIVNDAVNGFAPSTGTLTVTVTTPAAANGSAKSTALPSASTADSEYSPAASAFDEPSLIAAVTDTFDASNTSPTFTPACDVTAETPVMVGSGSGSGSLFSVTFTVMEPSKPVVALAFAADVPVTRRTILATSSFLAVAGTFTVTVTSLDAPLARAPTFTGEADHPVGRSAGVTVTPV